MHDTRAFVSPPIACKSRGTYIFSKFLAITDFAMDGNISPYIFKQSKNIFHCSFTNFMTYLFFFRLSAPFKYLSSLRPLIYAWCNLNQLLKFKNAAKQRLTNLIVIADWWIWYSGISNKSNEAKTAILSATQ